MVKKLLANFLILTLVAPAWAQNQFDDDQMVELDDRQQRILDEIVAKDGNMAKRMAAAEVFLKEFTTKANKLASVTKDGELEESRYQNMGSPWFEFANDEGKLIKHWKGNYPVTLDAEQIAGINSSPYKETILKYIATHPNFEDIEGIFQINFGNTCSVPVSYQDPAKSTKALLSQMPYVTDNGKKMFDAISKEYSPKAVNDDPNMETESEETSEKSNISHYQKFSAGNVRIKKLMHEDKLKISAKAKGGVKLLPVDLLSNTEVSFVVPETTTAPKVTIEIFDEDLLKDQKEESVYRVSDAQRASIKNSVMNRIKTLEAAGKEAKVIGAVCRSSASRITVIPNGPQQVGKTLPTFKTPESDRHSQSNISNSIHENCLKDSGKCNHKLSALRRTFCMGAVENIVDEIRATNPQWVQANKTSMKPDKFSAENIYYEDSILMDYLKMDEETINGLPFLIFPGTDAGYNLDGTSGPEYYMCYNNSYSAKNSNCNQKNKEGKNFPMPNKNLALDPQNKLDKAMETLIKGGYPTVTDQKELNEAYYHRHQYSQMYFFYQVKDKPEQPKEKTLKCEEYAIIQLYMDKGAKKKCVVENPKTKENEIKECSGTNGKTEGRKRRKPKKFTGFYIDCKPKSKGPANCFSFRNKRPICNFIKGGLDKLNKVLVK